MNLEDIKKLMKLIEESKLSRFHLKKGDFELTLEKGISSAPSLPPTYAYPLPNQANPVNSTGKEDQKEVHSGSFIKAPMIGTYYSSPGPDKKPFVQVGDMVEADQVICIIEAMKVMNEVKAGIRGVVKDIFCKNAQLVEFGTKLLRIE